MNTNTYENKADFDPNRAPEEVIVISLGEDGSAVARLARLSQHTMTIDSSIVAGRHLKIGDRLTVRATKPELFGFRNASRVWQATSIETKGSGS